MTESGALYAMFLPDRWNGRLVIFIHGLVDPARPIALPTLGAAADTQRVHCNALAYSSFSENGWAVKDGAQRTHELSALFAGQFGAPSHTYLYGQSMGGLIALKLAESYPTQYAGVLAECGILGGSFARFRYMFDVRLLFDFFYPDVLPGSVLAVPDGLDLINSIRLPARAAMATNPAGAHKIASIVQTPVPFSSDAELVMSIEDQLFRHAREVNDLIARGHGEPAVGNRDIEYTGALDPELLQAINASVPRFDAGRYAAHYASQYYEPDGDLHVPVLTLFTPRDPALPAVMSEVVYQARVASAGQSDFLRRQQSSVGYGHCTSRLADRMAAFNSLVNWVEPVEP
ncbi:MAG TPA: alpha/beta hydrolase [Gemmatimonadales bacterium]|nr:alpha/beta hydrolase [Gemmatimonadales bacterium]